MCTVQKGCQCFRSTSIPTVVTVPGYVFGNEVQIAVLVTGELGNNAQLAELLGIEQLHPLEKSPMSIPIWGELRSPMTGEEFAEKIEKILNRKPLICIENGPCLIRKVGICTGGGQGYIDLAAAQGCDAFVTGEVSEQTIHSAREQGIHFFAAGHHAT